MRTKLIPSISSRTSVRGLIIACMPAAAFGVVANSSVLGAVASQRADHDLTADDNTSASTNGPAPHAPSTNSGSGGTNNDLPQGWAGLRG